MKRAFFFKATFLLYLAFFFASFSKAQTIEPLLKTLWNQNAPFNLNIPNGLKAGCGPIAVSQILNYYKAPTHGYGHVTLYNDLDYTTVEGIDYNNILNRYQQGSYNQTQANAVANLVWHVGAAMTVKYNNYKTATENNRMIWGLQKYLHISQKSRFRLRKFYSTEQWIKMLDEQLASGHPVYYRGRAFRYKSDTTGIGHIFVIDGKNKEGEYHFNYGHASTSQDKFTSLNVINQSNGYYPGDYGVYYNWEQGMATDLYPDENFKESEFNDYPLYLTEPLCLNKDKRLNEITLAVGSTFYLTMKLQVYNLDYILQNGNNVGTWQVALGVYQDGKLKMTISSSQESELSIRGSVIKTLSYNIPSTLNNGVYDLCVVTRRSEGESWKPVWDVAPNQMTATIYNNTVNIKTMGNHTLETNLYLLEEIKEVGDVGGSYPGKLFSLKIKNPSDNNFENKIKLNVISKGVLCASYEQMSSVYSDCEVEYRFLIPNEVFDFTCNSDYTIKACYYEHNSGKYINLTTDVPISQPKGDVNGDMVVDVADIASVIDVMAKSVNNPAADVNIDGAVDVADIATIISIMANSTK